MAEYRFVTAWTIQASRERTWAALTDRGGYSAWWPSMPRCQRINPAVRGLGAITEQEVRGRLPYALRYSTVTTEFDPPNVMAYNATGDLEGEGRMIFEPGEDGGTKVTFHWNVRTNHRLLNWLSPLLRPVFAWNHNAVMSEGEAGLNAWLNHPIRANLEAEELRLE